MRYLLQLFVMSGDVMVFMCCVLVLYYGPLSLLAWLIVFCALATFRKAGGFDAWRLKNIKQFLHNARRHGL